MTLFDYLRKRATIKFENGETGIDLLVKDCCNRGNWLEEKVKGLKKEIKELEKALEKFRTSDDHSKG